jgi:hypothetical protein
MRSTRRTIVAVAASFAAVLGVGGIAAATSGKGPESDRKPPARVSALDEPTSTMADDTGTTIVGSPTTTDGQNDDGDHEDGAHEGGGRHGGEHEDGDTPVPGSDCDPNPDVPRRVCEAPASLVAQKRRIAIGDGVARDGFGADAIVYETAGLEAPITVVARTQAAPTRARYAPSESSPLEDQS